MTGRQFEESFSIGVVARDKAAHPVALDLSLVACLALVPHSEHEHGVGNRYEAIKQDVPSSRSPNNQFAFATLHRTSEERARGEYLHRLDDFGDAVRGIRRVRRGNVVEESVKVFQNFRSEEDPGQ